MRFSSKNSVARARVDFQDALKWRKEFTLQSIREDCIRAGRQERAKGGRGEEGQSGKSKFALTAREKCSCLRLLAV